MDSFCYEVEQSEGLWREIQAETGSTGDLAKRVSVDAFSRVSVTFEAFRSDWHIAAINRDSSQFKATLDQKIEGAVNGRFPGLGQHVRLGLSKHPSLERLREILAPGGQHVSLGSYKLWAERADEQLVEPWVGVVKSLPTQDRKLMDAVIATRNLLSHQSVKASDAMNSALRNLHGLHDANLRRGTNRIQPSGVGSYLNADRNGERRIEIYHRRLRELAECLRVAV